MKIQTVTIIDDNRRGFKTINEIEFDPKKHKLFKKKAVRAPRKTKKAE